MSALDLWEPLDVLSISTSAGIWELSDVKSWSAWSGFVAKPLPKLLLLVGVASVLVVGVAVAGCSVVEVGWSVLVVVTSVGRPVVVLDWSVGRPVVVLVWSVGWSVLVVVTSVGWPVVVLV